MVFRMRTTLEIEDDVLLAVKDLAARKHSTVGREISEMVRKSLQAGMGTPRKRRNGVPLFPVKRGGATVTMELVNRLRDEAS